MTVASGVVEGERGTWRNAGPPNIFRNAVPQIMSGQGGTVMSLK